MSEKFFPVETVNVYCRFCQKLMPAQLDRSIAGEGKTVDRNSTFEYYCTKCFRTFCFSGNDLIEKNEAGSKGKPEVRPYKPTEHYFIGEIIQHKEFRQKGTVVNKEQGKPARILVHFEKLGLKKLVEDV